MKTLVRAMTEATNQGDVEKAVSIWEGYDNLSLLQQLGVIPAQA